MTDGRDNDFGYLDLKAYIDSKWVQLLCVIYCRPPLLTGQVLSIICCFQQYLNLKIHENIDSYDKHHVVIVVHPNTKAKHIFVLCWFLLRTLYTNIYVYIFSILDYEVLWRKRYKNVLQPLKIGEDNLLGLNIWTFPKVKTPVKIAFPILQDFLKLCI